MMFSLGGDALARERDEAERRDDRREPDEQRDQRADERAEHDHEDDDRERDRDHAGLGEAALDLLVERLVGRDADRLDGQAGVSRPGLVDGGVDLVDVERGLLVGALGR